MTRARSATPASRAAGPAPADARILLSAAVDTDGARSGSTPHTSTTGSTTASRASARCSRSTRRSAALGRDKDSPPQILCGDFNAIAESDKIRFLRGLTTLGGRRTHFQDAWLRLHREPEPGDGPAEGITWSSENRFTRPLRSLDLDRRIIDDAFATTCKKDGRGTVHDCRVVLTEREGIGGVAICASDHHGVCADIQVRGSLG